MEVDLSELDPRKRYALLISTIWPRPIAFVSTLGPDGRANVAPFSFFNVMAGSPPTIVLGLGYRDGEPKDTPRNIAASREFVVNVVDEALVERANLASAAYPYGESEFAVAGLTAEPSVRVRPPRVAESPAHLECRLRQLITLEAGQDGTDLVIGEVLHVHVRDDALGEGGLPDAAKLRLVARLGGPWYCRASDRFRLLRPKDPDRQRPAGG